MAVDHTGLRVSASIALRWGRLYADGARRRASVPGVEGTGWDIGYAVRFLQSAEARYITGQTLVVDGGATLVGPARAPE
jgi:NAD(P)-dependent dehydrogenase (short-subunit alcohol dehydrogenase family)